MVSTNLLVIILFLSLLLLLLVFLYINKRRKVGKREKNRKGLKKEAEQKQIDPTFESLKAVIKNRQSSRQELEKAVTDLMHYYGEIPPKRGVSADKLFSEYAMLLIAVCRHQNTNAQIVLQFDKELRKKNPTYASNIDDILARGLNSRG